MTSKKQSFIVSHLSARRQYDVAKILYKNGFLNKLFTDAYYSPDQMPVIKILDRLLPNKIVNTYKNYQAGIPIRSVKWDWFLALLFKFSLIIKRNGNYSAKIKANQYLANAVIKYCQKSGITGNYYGFDAASLEFFEWAYDKNWSLYLEQCGAPRGVTIKMHEDFESTLKIDESEMIKECLAMHDREIREWELATKIIVPSKFVYDSVISEGAKQEKVFLVNYGYDPKYPENTVIENANKKLSNPNKKLKVLFCGNAGFRKGLHDLVKLAEIFKNEAVEFRVVGSIENRCLSLVKSYSGSNIQFLGKLNSKEVQDEYLQADIFMLPSYIEGSAMVNFEAMSLALPIITTYESGSVLTHGIDGFLSHAGDIETMEASLYNLIRHPEIRHKMGLSAMHTLKQYSIKAYEDKLIRVLMS